MKSKIYEQMESLQKYKDSNDVSFFGTIELEELDESIKTLVKNTYDVFISIEDGPQGPVFKFYNKELELMAINLNDGQGTLPTAKFADKLPPEILKQFDEFSYLPENSLNQINSDLEKISQVLGIPKKDIMAIADTSYSKEISDDKKNDDDKIHLKDEDELKKEKNAKKRQSPKEEKKLEALEKQQTSLSQKVNDRYTLGEILGVPNDGTLVAVYSDSIENGKQQNHTKFSFLIKDKECNYKECPNIEQVGGITPDTQVAVSSSKGDEVETKQVNSLYRIKSSNNIEYMLTANIGSQGTIDLGIGQRDRTQGENSSDLATVTTPLKTTSTYYTTPETREAINGTKDGYKQATRRVEEGQKHLDKDCDATKDEFDGDKDTGHSHNEEEFETSSIPQPTVKEFEEIAQKILDNNPEIDRVFTLNEVKKQLMQDYEKSSNKSISEIAENTETNMEQDASHIPTRTL